MMHSLLKKNELLGRSFAQRARPKVEDRGEKLARDITNASQQLKSSASFIALAGNSLAMEL
jgi:hypothetical protein